MTFKPFSEGSSLGLSTASKRASAEGTALVKTVAEAIAAVLPTVHARRTSRLLFETTPDDGAREDEVDQASTTGMARCPGSSHAKLIRRHPAVTPFTFNPRMVSIGCFLVAQCPWLLASTKDLLSLTTDAEDPKPYPY